jgi:hypothetical protein
MSLRPSTIAINDLNADACPNSDTFNGWLIVGDTAANTLYSYRLIQNGVTQRIISYVEGVDRTNQESIQQISFPLVTTNNILSYLRAEQVRIVTAGDNDFEADACPAVRSRVYQYFVGSGINGDQISAYGTVMYGPWFQGSVSQTRLEKFITQNTIQVPAAPLEIALTSNLRSAFQLNKSVGTLLVRQPSTLDTQYLSLVKQNGEFVRQLYLDYFNFVNQAPNYNVYTEAYGLKLTPTKFCGVYNATFSTAGGNTQTFENMKVVWKTNPLSYIRIATQADLCPAPQTVAATYRAVMAIAKCNENSAIDLTNAVHMGNLITSAITFSLHDVSTPKQAGTMGWFVMAYTADEDLSVVSPNAGMYSTDNATLLMVEMVCTKNKRKITYDVANREVVMQYNENSTETAFFNDATKIASMVYTAYTGLKGSLPSTVAVCNNGYCMDVVQLTNAPGREMLITTALELAGLHYGSTIYPVAGKRTC